MNSSLSSKDRDLLQRFIDGRTSEEQARACEEKLAHDAAFRKEYEEIKSLQSLLNAGKGMDRDPAFWSKLTERLAERSADEKNLLPFPQKYIPFAAVAFAAVVLFAFSFVFENRLSFLRFWENQTEVVLSAYDENIGEGGYIPLFSNLDSDRALQFALYGSLPLDESRGTVLNVDERASEGYKIEVQQEAPRKQKKVTVADFVAEVRPTNAQQAVIESLLAEARRELASSVLVGKNDAVAINTDLSRLNKAMASGIVSVLEPSQRTRLNTLLTEFDAAYSVMTRRQDSEPARRLIKTLKGPRPESRFVVLSPDTISVQQLHVNIEQIHKEMKESQFRFQEVQAIRLRTFERLANEAVVYSGSVPAGALARRISLRAKKDRLIIQIESDSALSNLYKLGVGEADVILGMNDSAAAVLLELEQRALLEEVSASRRADIAAPRADSVKRRKPFKLDIN